MTTKENTKTEKKVLRILIDGNWSTSEFSNFFENLHFLYQILVELNNITTDESQSYLTKPNSEISKEVFNLNGELFKKLSFPNTFENDSYFEGVFRIHFQHITSLEKNNIDDLEVKEIKYASPGFTDLVGIGKIMEQLFGLLRYYFPNKKDRIEAQIREEDLISKKVHNLQIIGYSKKDLRKLIESKNSSILSLKQLELEGKIDNFEIRDLN